MKRKARHGLTAVMTVVQTAGPSVMAIAQAVFPGGTTAQNASQPILTIRASRKGDDGADPEPVDLANFVDTAEYFTSAPSGNYIPIKKL
jgi:hypothetical protein